MDDVLEHPALDDRDESVRIAVRALGDMRNSVHGSPSASLTIASRSSSPSLLEEEPDFVSRVSHYPIVNTALRAYEQGKASSRVVKYGAEMMESSVKTISRPVIDRLPVNQIDEFACRQLDRLDRLGSYSRRRSTSEVPQERERGREREESPAPRSGSSRGWTSALRDISSARGRTNETSPPVDPYHDRDVSMSRADEDRTSDRDAERRNRTPTPRQDDLSASSENQQQVAQRSRWQAMLLEAGGISAAVSEESMRRLKYCLQWLQYATNQIDQQILKLRDFIASMQDSSSPSSSSHSPHSISSTVAEDQLQALTAIRRDVVDTIRQVVDVVSKYAGGALPEPARARVRAFILCLPQRWQQAAERTLTVNGAGANAAEAKKDSLGGRGRGRTTASAPYSYGPGEAGPSQRSRPASRASSPSSLRSHGRGFARQANGIAPPTTSTTTQAAQKILTLATESLDMLRAVTTVFKESLDKADAWVERLRIVGLQRQNSAMTPPPTLPPPSTLESYRDPLPPILTPGSSRAHSPESPFAQLTLPPLDPSLYAPHGHAYHRGHHHHHGHNHMHNYPPVFSNDGLQGRAGDTARDLDALSLSARSGYATPRSATALLSPEGEGGLGRDVLQGVREESMSSRMEVDS
ncbi:hypothetical protein EIP86_005604 [Pleurotus ostreatoroseus]|nr:hypothetical protein EIP86_005604 [Pleurotus ostreatoroseus]